MLFRHSLLISLFIFGGISFLCEGCHCRSTSTKNGDAFGRVDSSMLFSCIKDSALRDSLERFIHYAQQFDNEEKLSYLSVHIEERPQVKATVVNSWCFPVCRTRHVIAREVGRYRMLVFYDTDDYVSLVPDWSVELAYKMIGEQLFFDYQGLEVCRILKVFTLDNDYWSLSDERYSGTRKKRISS